MIYAEDLELNENLITVLMNAFCYLDATELSDSCFMEAVKYVEQDIRFVASGRIPDSFFILGHVKFHYTDQ